MITQPRINYFESSELASAHEQGKIGFSCYGLNFGLIFDDLSLYEKLDSILPPFHEKIDFAEAQHVFRLITGGTAESNGLYFDTERIYECNNSKEISYEAIESKIQFSLSVALPPEKFFLHAGAVALDNIGIIIPGNSFSGKTTLTHEFLKAGARYYSDDCAVIDKNGLLYPYSKTLSIRKKKYIRAEKSWDKGENVRAESMGFVPGKKSVKIGLIILAEYEDDKIWQSKILSPGEAVMELAQNLFYPASMTLYPAETLGALTKLAEMAVTMRGVRGEAKDTVEKILHDFNVFKKPKPSI